MLKQFFSQLDRFRVSRPGLTVSSRVNSVDALRGFDLFWIIGAEAMLKSLNRIFDSPTTNFISTQLNHVEWTGFRFYELIMPLFLFIVGVSLPFSFRRRLEKSPSKATLWPHIIKRVLLLWILGIAVQGNLFDYDWSKIKFYSNTLQAIASGYLISAILVLYLKVSWQAIGTLLLMLVYWAILALAPVPGIGAGVITPDGNFAIYFDKLILGSFQDGTTYSWIISSLNFGATTMLGVFAGYLLQSELKINKKVIWLVIAGIALIILGSIWHIWLPSVKHIWTSSFVLFSGGICLLSLALFLWLVDGLNFKKGFLFFTIIGMNAIFAYCASHLFDFGQVADVVVGGLKQHTGDWYRFIRALGGFGVLYLILWQMYKHKIFIKI
jgi:predicted acyltransferase